MKKKILSAVLVASMVASVPAYAETKEEIVLTFPTFWIGENTAADYMAGAVERFNELYDGVYQVELEEVVENGYGEEMAIRFQTGNYPTLMHHPGTEFVDKVVIPNKMYYPMNDFLEDNPNIVEWSIEGGTDSLTLENGDIVGVPRVHTAPGMIYYNSKLYQPDKKISEMTFDEYLESLGDNKMALMSGENAWTPMMLLSALLANEEGGVELMREYASPDVYLVDYNQPCIINAVTKLDEIWTEFAQENAVGAIYAEAANTFFSNEAAVIYNGTWMNADLKEANSGNWSEGFDGADVLCDYYPGNVAIEAAAGYEGYFFMTNGGTEEEQECALAFLSFLHTKEELEAWQIEVGYVVPGIDHSEEFYEALESDPLAKLQAELASGDAVYVPRFCELGYGSVGSDVFADCLTRMATDDITPEEFCQIMTDASMEAAAAAGN